MHDTFSCSRKLSRRNALLAAGACLLSTFVLPRPATANTAVISAPPSVSVMGPDGTSGSVVFDTTSTFGGTVTLTAHVSDPDSNTLTIQWVVDGVPMPTTTLTGTGTTTSGDVVLNVMLATGTHEVTVIVSDGSKATTVTTSVIPFSTPGVKVTGGGAIVVGSGKGTFGLTAMTARNGAARGNLVYQDHTTGMTLKSTEITAVVASGVHVRISGKAMINESDTEYLFVVDLDDNGEPGAGVDTWGIQISNGYRAGGIVTDGGNLQLHK